MKVGEENRRRAKDGLDGDAVRRAQSIREAARQLNVASSAVNRQIIKLEEEIGEPLFHRLPSGLVLTPVGEALAHHVITVFQDLERTGAERMRTPAELDSWFAQASRHVERAAQLRREVEQVATRSMILR